MVKLVKASCDSALPFCVHYGFLIDNLVIHNTPGMENNYGGNIVAQSFDDFKKERKIFEIEDIDIKPQKVFDYANENKTRKFNYLTYNCQQFANQIIKGVKYTSVLTRALILAGVGIFIYNYQKN